MRILVINSGSSSLKFAVYDTTDGDRLSLTQSGAVSGIGGNGTLRLHGAAAAERARPLGPLSNHTRAISILFESLKPLLAAKSIDAVGHRVVHGGVRFQSPVLIDDGVVREIERLIELAPLHNPPSLAGIRAVQSALPPDVPMVAVFDTAFHRTMPWRAAHYAVDPDVAARYEVHRYGFHGIAHASMMHTYCERTERPVADVRLITLQLGNGCSITAIDRGRSVDTSMGFTPLEGLVMGTRSGDIDAAVIPYLAGRQHVSADTVEEWLNTRSGLLGVSGVSNDMRAVVSKAKSGDARARQAIDLFCYRARKYLGAYLAALGGADAVIFGGGIGEHAADIRAGICKNMDWCGLAIDEAGNAGVGVAEPGTIACISRADAVVTVHVAGVDEEGLIARETLQVLRQAR